MTAAIDRFVPQLVFQLPGRWITLDPRDEQTTAARITAEVRDALGVADDAAAARRRLRDALQRSAETARDAGAHALFLCTEIAPGVTAPVAVSVHAPAAMRMTPAIGTSPDAVLATLRESFTALDIPEIDTATRLDGPHASMLRLERLIEEVVDENGETAVSTRLEVDYWFAVPSSKQVALALFATPLGELHHAMRNLFDSIALAASFGPQRPA